jgi:hypothetical protein
MDDARPDDVVEWNIHQMQWVGDANICVIFLPDYILNLEMTQALSPVWMKLMMNFHGVAFALVIL